MLLCLARCEGSYMKLKHKETRKTRCRYLYISPLFHEYPNLIYVVDHVSHMCATHMKLIDNSAKVRILRTKTVHCSNKSKTILT